VALGVGVAGAFAYLLWRIRGDLAATLHRVGPAGLPWLAVAVAAEAASFCCYALAQRRLLAAGGARLGHGTMVGLTAAATGLTNLVPGGAAPASGWLVAQYRRHGVPMALALWTVLAGGFAAAFSVLFLLACGAAVAGLLTAGAFVGVLAVLAAGGAAVVWASRRTASVRAWLAGARHIPGAARLGRLTAGAGEVMGFRATLRGGAEVYALSIANWLFDVTVLGCAFAVLGLPLPWRALLFAYAISQVAGALAPLPGGVGFVEGGMIGALTLTGTHAGAAVVATVAYRLVTTLGMAAFGTGALFVVHHRAAPAAELTGEAAELAGRRSEAVPETAAAPRA
jgi:uncharacterized membrane protein YbhN (UPF0104 family)